MGLGMPLGKTPGLPNRGASGELPKEGWDFCSGRAGVSARLNQIQTTQLPAGCGIQGAGYTHGQESVQGTVCETYVWPMASQATNL